MNLSAAFGAVAPLFFVLLLGYLSGKTHSFSQEQAEGLGKLALSFALPASLFVGMSGLPQGLLATQLTLALCLLAVHVGLFLLAHLLLHKVLHLETARSLVFSLVLVTSATPIFGIAVLSPLLGSTTIAAVGLVALALNLAVPVAITLFEINAAAKPPDQSSPSNSRPLVKSPIVKGLLAGVESPLLWAPILGGALAISGLHLPAVVNSSLNFIGSATSGVAVFAVGLILAAQRLTISRSVVFGTVGRLSLQTSCLFVLAKLLHVGGPIYHDAFICCSFPLAATVNLLAAKYKAAEAEAASVLLLSTALLAVTIPVFLYINP